MPRYIFILIFAGVAVLLGYPTFKRVFMPPTDPAHLEKVPHDFRYEKIYDQEHLEAALESIIKKGMSKEEVDSIFIDAAGGYSQSIQEGKELYYKYTKTVKVFCGVVQNENSQWKFAVQYDEDNKIIPFESKTNQNVLYDALWPCF
jgi:hypothetical protein